MKKLALVIINLLFFTFYACSSTSPSIYSTNSLDSQDIDSLIQSHINSLLSKGFIKKIKSQKVIAISDIENATGEKIDIDSLMTRFKNALSDEERFVFSRAIAGSGGKIDTLLKDPRNLRNNEEFNQYTTKGKGELLAPDYSLSGKITKRTKSMGKNVLVEYEFLLSLIDLSTGVEVWNNIAKFSKAVKLQVVKNHKPKDINQNNISKSEQSDKYNAAGDSVKDTKERLRGTMKPYKQNGKWYHPQQVNLHDSFDGVASWYGLKFHAEKTATGEKYNPNAHTAAHKTMPMNTMVRVYNLENGKSTLVRINDRGPFVEGHIIDVSKAAAQDLDMMKKGTAKVRLEVVGFQGVVNH